jgi:hypothetical protein
MVEVSVDVRSLWYKYPIIGFTRTFNRLQNPFALATIYIRSKNP